MASTNEYIKPVFDEKITKQISSVLSKCIKTPDLLSKLEGKYHVNNMRSKKYGVSPTFNESKFNDSNNAYNISNNLNNSLNKRMHRLTTNSYNSNNSNNFEMVTRNNAENVHNSTSILHKILYVNLDCLNKIAIMISKYLSKTYSDMDISSNKYIREINKYSKLEKSQLDKYSDKEIFEFKNLIDKYLKKPHYFYNNEFKNIQLEVYNSYNDIISEKSIREQEFIKKVKNNAETRRVLAREERKRVIEEENRLKKQLEKAEDEKFAKKLAELKKPSK
jgi:hypothetical protein